MTFLGDKLLHAPRLGHMHAILTLILSPHIFGNLGHIAKEHTDTLLIFIIHTYIHIHTLQSEQISSITGSLPTMCFATSIWDETLYRYVHA